MEAYYAISRKKLIGLSVWAIFMSFIIGFTFGLHSDHQHINPDDFKIITDQLEQAEKTAQEG